MARKRVLVQAFGLMLEHLHAAVEEAGEWLVKSQCLDASVSVVKWALIVGILADNSRPRVPRNLEKNNKATKRSRCIIMWHSQRESSLWRICTLPRTESRGGLRPRLHRHLHPRSRIAPSIAILPPGPETPNLSESCLALTAICRTHGQSAGHGRPISSAAMGEARFRSWQLRAMPIFLVGEC